MLLKRDDLSGVTDSGLHIPVNARLRPLQAEVVAVGSGCCEVVVGNRVQVTNHGGTAIKASDGDYFLLEEEEIVAIIR